MKRIVLIILAVICIVICYMINIQCEKILQSNTCESDLRIAQNQVEFDQIIIENQNKEIKRLKVEIIKLKNKIK